MRALQKQYGEMGIVICSVIDEARHAGEERPPLQMWALRNAGTDVLHWALDLAPLDALAADNWGCAFMFYVLVGLSTRPHCLSASQM
jgi:hypothetical protein